MTVELAPIESACCVGCEVEPVTDLVVILIEETGNLLYYGIAVKSCEAGTFAAVYCVC